MQTTPPIILFDKKNIVRSAQNDWTTEKRTFISKWKWYHEDNTSNWNNQKTLYLEDEKKTITDVMNEKNETIKFKTFYITWKQ